MGFAVGVGVGVYVAVGVGVSVAVEVGVNVGVGGVQLIQKGMVVLPKSTRAPLAWAGPAIKLMRMANKISSAGHNLATDSSTRRV